MNRMVDRSLQTRVKPVRLGFLGIGWIGRNRMEAILRTRMAEAVAIADPCEEMTTEALRLAPDAEIVGGLDALLSLDLDGVVIATPSALHAEQSIRALQAGVAVFCQKPLGRSAAEAAAVVAAARSADRLLGVDLSYRYTQGMTPLMPSPGRPKMTFTSHSISVSINMSAALGIELVLCLSKIANLRRSERFRMHVPGRAARARTDVAGRYARAHSHPVRQAVDEDRDVKQEGDDGHGRNQGDGNASAFQAVSLLFSAGTGCLYGIVFGLVHQGFASVEIFAGS